MFPTREQKQRRTISRFRTNTIQPIAVKEKMSATKPHNTTLLTGIAIAICIALGSITLPGCSAEDESLIDLPGESVAVLFDAGMISETQSRATSMDLASLHEDGFGVLAYYTNGYNWNNVTTPNFMYNQKVNWNMDHWDYSPVKYWPIVSNDKVTFFAYAPYDDQQPSTLSDNHGIALSGNTLAAAPYIDFTVNTNSIADQVDLVYASAIDKNKESVDLQFHHALSRIGFTARTDVDYGDTEVKVTSLSIKGTFYPSGQFNLGDGTWSSKSETTDITTYTPQLNANANAIDNIAQQIHNNDQYLMLIPQQFEGESNRLTIEATCSFGSSVKTITEDINLNFEQSKAYNIALVISAEDTGSGFSIVVTPWVNVQMQREFTGFVITDTNWAPLTREIPDLVSSVRFVFTMSQPVGRIWKATLSNGLDFALDQNYALTGSSGMPYQVGIKALKPAGSTDRTTEFYLTIDGKEVDTNGDGETGHGHRYLITQKAAM